MRRRSLLAAAVAAPIAACSTHQEAVGTGRTLRVAPGDSLARAVAAARDGDTLALLAGVHAGQAAVITQGRLTLRGEGGKAVLLAAGAEAEGKALIVVRHGDVRIEDLEFRGTRVANGNGAGIRFEGGKLALRRCGFFDNEMGLLSANVADGELSIEDCEFGAAPRHAGLLHHLLYVGRMARLSLTGSRFSGGWRGHLVKSRAAVNHIRCNQLVDGATGGASYLVDLPNGGQCWLQGNVLAQGPGTQNVALVAWGAEAQAHPASHLVVTHNHFLNDAEAPAAFVRSWPERLPTDASLRLANNLFVGAAIDGSWGRPEDGNRWRPLTDRQQALTAPPCPAA